MIIYCWKNLLNGKEYIGFDSKDGERVKSHLQCVDRGCINCGSLFHRAIKKHGLENFDYSILETGFETVRQLHIREYELMHEHRSLSPSGYNLQDGEGSGFGEESNEKYEKILDYLPPIKSRKSEYGTQIKKVRTLQRESPIWTLNDAEVRIVLLRSFPNLHRGGTYAMRAGRWLRIINLYYRLKMPNRQVANEIGISTNALKSCLKAMNRVQKGRSADNRRILGARPIGRPKLK